MAAPAGSTARRIAIDAVQRIDVDHAYANLALPSVLADSGLDERDRGLVTELVYGSTRMRRACDWLVDRYLAVPPPPALRAALRVGAYQVAFMRVPPHAAVSATVDAVSKRNRGVVNAVLRKVSGSLPVEWPDEGTRLSVPDWLLERLRADVGESEALAMCEAMNQAPTVTERADGYVQDEASQWVVAEVGAEPGDLVLDACAAPGGKATGLASTASDTGAPVVVIGADRRRSRVGLISANAVRVGVDAQVLAVVADAAHPPYRSASFDRVLIDAPCSGLGVLRRRADARWRITAADVDRLAALQRSLLVAAAPLVRPGGRLVYSVCTVTRAETIDIAEAATDDWAAAGLVMEPVPVSDTRWRPLGHGGMVLPQDHDTDGMAMFKWERAAD